MSGINLAKRAEHVGIVLAKRGITTAPTVRVGLALDVSGSTRSMFGDGTIQETVDRLLAVALKFDDNGELDVWSFDNQSSALKTAAGADYNTYVTENILNNNRISKWGGTSYAPCMKSIRDFYFPSLAGATASAKPVEEPGFLGKLFGKKAAAPVVESATTTEEAPAMVLFVTDGENDDKAEAERILKAAQNSNVYWQLIGVGPARYFNFLEKMADDLPNVGFVNLTSLAMSDEDLYTQLVSEEFVTWVKKL